MFKSFFPKPNIFFSSLILWIIFLITVWYSFGASIGGALGFDLSSAKPVIGLGHFITAEFLWFDVFYLFGVLIFYLAWRTYSPHFWQNWSILGSALLIYLSYASVQVSVIINAWYGPFYDDIQTALAGNGDVSVTQLYGHFIIFCTIAFPYIAFIIANRFFTSHFIFRWRTAMNDFYVTRWKQVRHIEGASQRIQEDTMRFAAIMEGLGVAFVDSIMTLIAFLPVLAALSIHVESLPILGSIPYPLVTLSISWSIFGTLVLLLAGIRLPGLEFKNQRVEAAFRKELVLGEDNQENAQPIALRDLFSNVRRNYFRIYLHYTYFNLFRYMYIQADNVIAYIFLIPTIVSGRITLGIMNQILRAFGQVASSFQFLVSSWTTIIELISIYKRLKAFDAAINKQPLPKIEQDFVESGSKEI
ncbi:MAG: peptide antibiotic transporter SbmA [Amylibacter sp.]|jgi:peptide/bleomycin uptake transporter|tara:strand:- start:3852 stop:5099 length:1248 start_codon:yes stop_codon:yes gene_type:complete